MKKIGSIFGIGAILLLSGCGGNLKTSLFDVPEGAANVETKTESREAVSVEEAEEMEVLEAEILDELESIEDDLYLDEFEDLEEELFDSVPVEAVGANTEVESLMGSNNEAVESEIMEVVEAVMEEEVIEAVMEEMVEVSVEKAVVAMSEPGTLGAIAEGFKSSAPVEEILEIENAENTIDTENIAEPEVVVEEESDTLAHKIVQLLVAEKAANEFCGADCDDISKVSDTGITVNIVYEVSEEKSVQLTCDAYACERTEMIKEVEATAASEALETLETPDIEMPEPTMIEAEELLIPVVDVEAKETVGEVLETETMEEYLESIEPVAPEEMVQVEVKVESSNPEVSNPEAGGAEVLKPSAPKEVETIAPESTIIETETTNLEAGTNNTEAAVETPKAETEKVEEVKTNTETPVPRKRVRRN